ncbi:unnamed protein product [Kuraishia capsulata CBS 1993]|uniref:USP domain-containing protein n=1 Tax=Kuraishia capsulata CBS 1993 TaxID=1382522 RepID=W6MM67_9ASCO|nr:uncharacterized protein KUCA_T00003266001 [Kuraishia capsulata CBS 1993]CDK27288.1 unnamed protein product [Kuraishia capsulata CBS 1993]
MSVSLKFRRNQDKSTTLSDEFWSEFLGVLKDRKRPSAALEKQLRSQISSFDRTKRNADEVTVALTSPFSDGSVSKAFKFVRFFDLAIASKLMSASAFYRQLPPLATSWEIPLVGMDNWNKVLCYLDSLLFALFARMESFDHLVVPRALDERMTPALAHQVAELRTLLRFVVNLLRAGEQVTTDVMQMLCLQLSRLGCDFCVSGKQQDSLVMFESLMECLGLPLLTLKIDIIHRGKFNLNDDLRFINERCLLISVPESSKEPESADDPVSLEECLNSYFNNSITVKRHIDRRRTIDSVRRPDLSEYAEQAEPEEKEMAHYEGLVVERIASHDTLNGVFSNDSTIRSEVSAESSAQSRLKTQRPENGSISKVSDILERSRTRSSTIVSVLNSASHGQPALSRRESSFSHEVNLPAWMFLQLLPYYPNPDVELKPNNEEASYGGTDEDVDPLTSPSPIPSRSRPVVPICLKRYVWSTGGHKIKRKVVIPPFIKHPYFISEDNSQDGVVNFKRDDSLNAPCGSFMLVLESCVCHRGSSVNSGHYVALSRKHPFHRDQLRQPQDDEPWLLFNDMEKGREKVKELSFKDAMDSEFPYLLFYRIVDLDLSDADLSDDRPTIKVSAPNGSKERFWTESDDSGRTPRKGSYFSEISITSVSTAAASAPASAELPSVEDRLNSHRRHLHPHFLSGSLSRSVSRTRKREEERIEKKADPLFGDKAYVDPSDMYYFYTLDNGELAKSADDLRPLQLTQSRSSKPPVSSSGSTEETSFTEKVNQELVRLVEAEKTGSTVVPTLTGDDVNEPESAASETSTTETSATENKPTDNKPTPDPTPFSPPQTKSAPLPFPQPHLHHLTQPKRPGTMSIPILSPATSASPSDTQAASIASYKTIGALPSAARQSKNRLVTKSSKKHRRKHGDCIIA